MAAYSCPAAIAVFALLIAAVPQASAQKEGDLQTALKRVGTASSYTFTVEETPSPGGKGPVSGRFQKGQPLAVTADKIECFRDGDKIVYREGDAWHRSKTGTVSDPLRVLGAISKVRTVRLPHEELAAFADIAKVSDGLAISPDGKTATRTVLKLKLEAARQLAPSQHKQVVQAGQIELRTEADCVVSYKIELRLQGRLGNAEIDGSHTRSVTLSQVGTTKVEVPDAARQALK